MSVLAEDFLWEVADFNCGGRWVEVPCFTARPGWRRRGVRRPLSPSDNNAGELWTHTANRVLTHGAFWSRLRLLWPLMLDHSVKHITPTLASSFYCLPALKSRPSVQLCMGSVPIYNRGMGAREGFLLLHCHYFPALPSFIHWPLLYFLFVQSTIGHPKGVLQILVDIAGKGCGLGSIRVSLTQSPSSEFWE